MRLRQGDADAIEQALKTITEDHSKASQRLQYIEILGELKVPASVPVLLPKRSISRPSCWSMRTNRFERGLLFLRSNATWPTREASGRATIAGFHVSSQ